MKEKLFCYATTSRGIEQVLQKELEQMGAEKTGISHSGVVFTCSLRQLYTICLWSRTANRVLLTIGTGTYTKEDDLYTLSSDFPWEIHMNIDSTFSITASSRDKNLANTSYIGLKVKDGLVDRFREQTGRRPSVDSEKPDITFHVHIEEGAAVLYLDASGGSLHQRGYRRQTVEAGLKEHAAAAMLMKSGWPKAAAAGKPFLDLMCGAGTIPIEAALIAHDIAPGIYRRYFGFYHWKHHRREEWSAMRKEARSKLDALQAGNLRIQGYDKDPNAVSAALANAKSAGVSDLVHFTVKALHDHTAASEAAGLICINPPYGVRLEEDEMIPSLYQEIGRQLKRRFSGWKSSVLVPNSDAGRYLGLQADSVSALSNGEIHSKLIQIDITPENSFRVHFPFYNGVRGTKKTESHIADLQNRLIKNRKQLSSYRKKHNVSCYRIYDADIPEYSAAIDIFEDTFAYIQEYEAPSIIPKEKARFRLIEIVNGVSEALNIPKENIYVTQRRRQRGEHQYGKLGTTESFIPVQEGGLLFLVNFVDYLDTGLFLEHRDLRSRIRNEIAGKKFLNLYAYTGTASIYAVDGGASEIVSVDTNSRYLEWGKQNLLLNNFPLTTYRSEKSDCLSWLEKSRDRFDCIFIDPPSFSNSKNREEDFVLDRDYLSLVKRGVELLTMGGCIYFTSHLKGFKPDFTGIDGITCTDITDEITPPDFSNGKRTYNCYKITK